MGEERHRHLIPADKSVSQQQLAALKERGAQRIYRGDERLTIGMPCGGILAGQLYVLGDGTLGCWQIDGNNYFAGVGHTSYRTYRPDRPIEQGFAVAITDRNGTRSTTPLGEEGYDAIEFVGEYPRAIVRYRSKQQPAPPVTIDLEVLSPFIPLDARASSHPATVLRFTLHNPTDGALDVSLGGWLQNMVFADRRSALTIRRQNRVVRGDGLTAVIMEAAERRPGADATTPITRVLADFESGTYDGWRAVGEAFGKAPAKGTRPGQQPVSGFVGENLVNTYHDPAGDKPIGILISDPFKIDLPYLLFRIGGGGHEGQTCLNLIVDNRVVRTATGRNEEALRARGWDVREFRGREAHLEIVDTHSGGWGHINIDHIKLTNTVPEDIREFDTGTLGYGNLALSLVGDGRARAQWQNLAAFLQDFAAGVEEPRVDADVSKPLVGTVVADFRLGPGETRDVTFIVSWYFPNLHTLNGRMYTNWFRDSRDVAVQLAAQLDELHRQTVLFCDTYYRETTLPWWLNSRLMMPTANLATGTAQWWKNGRFWAWEGVCCCHGTCTHVWNYAQGHAWLFPELARSARTMQDLGAGFHRTSGLVGFRSDDNFAADGQAGTILKCYREHLTSPDGAFLRKHWPLIRIALDYLISHDADNNGIIENEKQHNTYDINFVGPNTFVGALYLAALRAGAEMAADMNDEAAAARYRRLFEAGRAWTSKHLYNGEYYEQQVPPGDTRAFQYGRGCLSDQVFGQNWAHTLDLGYVLPRDEVRSALRSVFRYNWAPDVGPHNGAFPPERWFARPGDPGLFLCTWPRGGRPAEPVRYRDEVWSGIEYQVAAGLAWEGYVDEALLVVHGIEQRYHGGNHNPYNEVECGDHYARALASWGVLHALAGFKLDGPAGRVTIAPQLRPDDFACFFCAGTGWGTLRQQRADGAQTNTVEVVWGTLSVGTCVVALPDGVVPKWVTASVMEPDNRGRDVRADHTVEDGLFVVALGSKVELKAGQTLRVKVGW